jgi:hypothetical protein
MAVGVHEQTGLGSQCPSPNALSRGRTVSPGSDNGPRSAAARGVRGGVVNWVDRRCVVSGRVGKNRNILLVWLIWPLITLGVYHFVWYYKVNREARDFDRRIEVDPAIAVVAVLVGWLVIVPPFVSVFNTGRRIAEMQKSAGMRPSCNAWIGLILMIVAGLHSLYYQHELNQIWSHYGNPVEGEQVPLAV